MENECFEIENLQDGSCGVATMELEGCRKRVFLCCFGEKVFIKTAKGEVFSFSRDAFRGGFRDVFLFPSNTKLYEALCCPQPSGETSREFPATSC